jgi:hypothetical protein
MQNAAFEKKNRIKEFCMNLGPMFRDESMEKRLKKSELWARKSQKLGLEYEKVSSSLSLHKKINSNVDRFSQQMLTYFKSVSQLENDNELMEKAAITIQKYARGYLERVKIASVL